MTAELLHDRPEKGPCSHETYLLTCEWYDQLLLDVGVHCQICGGDAHAIDHDCMVGQWAVRGLLCHACNTRLAYNSAWSQASLAYLESPWWPTMLDRLGFTAEHADEPPDGATVVTLKHRWTRRTDMWHRIDDRPRMYSRPTTWHDLNRRYGPHNIVRNDAVQQSIDALKVATRAYRKATGRSGRREARDVVVRHAAELLRHGVGPAEMARLSPFTRDYIRTLARRQEATR